MVTSVSFGGGVNSTAMIVLLAERDERPDFVLFADTGGEREHTYAHVAEVDAWLRAREWPGITRVSNADPDGLGHGHASLEDECLRNRTLPSLAYGNKGCSVKWKRQPMERHLAAQPGVQAAWARGERVRVLLGIDAGESHRSAQLVATEHARWTYERPLVDAGWAREECIAAIERVGLSVPRKSACWFCPAMKRREVIALARDAPNLYARAVAMERNAAATNTRCRGLGRAWSWDSVVRADAAQLKLWPDVVEADCMCHEESAQ